MPSITLSKIAAAVLAVSASAMAAPQAIGRRTPELSLSTQLRLADSAVDRFALLPNDEDFVFDFTEHPLAPLATGKSFPALVGNGQSLAVAPLPACAMSILHLHPRASEAFVVTSGKIVTEMIPEQGPVDADGNPRVIHTELGPSQMTIFPQGSFHVQVNPECETAFAVASFNSEDPGFGGVVGQTFALSNDFIISNYGHSIDGADIDRIRDAIPVGIADAVDECLATCGIEKRSL